LRYVLAFLATFAVGWFLVVFVEEAVRTHAALAAQPGYFSGVRVPDAK